MAIAVVTDTDSSLSNEMAANLNIYHVPISIHFGDEILKSNMEVDDAALVARIENEKVLPTTSAPAPGEFSAVFEEAFQDGADEILCLTVSGEVSATYKAALTAKEMMKDKKITVVDTWSVSLGQGFMVIKAAEMARKNSSLEDILEAVIDVRNNTHLFASLATLKYMAMSGRVGAISAEMAKMLSIKPILTVKDGKLDLLEKIRTQRKAWLRLIELSKERLEDKELEQIYLIHVAAEKEVADFERMLREQIPCPKNIPVTGLSPGLSVHTGPGLVGLAFVTHG
jgi:DegV family protein with EDD domain